MIYVDLNPPEIGVPNFVVADAHHLPFRSGAFQEAHMRHVLEHLEEPGKAILEVWRVLALGGRLEVEVPGMFSCVLKLDPDHRWVFSPWMLKRLLKLFRSVRVWSEGISPRLIPLWPLRLLLARWLPRVPWFVAEYLRASCEK